MPRTRRRRDIASPSTCWARRRAPPTTRSAMRRATSRRSRPSRRGRVTLDARRRGAACAARALGEAVSAASALPAFARGAAARRTGSAACRACAGDARGLAAAHHRCRGGRQARSVARAARAAPHRPGACWLERAWACGAGLWQAHAAADRLAGGRLPRTGRRIPVRLVKGAYWDSEIKWAQEAGFAGYPVFTRKVNTDVAYLAAARALLARPEASFRNSPHTTPIPSLRSPCLPASGTYEFQRLYGMGEALHREVVRPEALGQAMPHLCAGRRAPRPARLSRATALGERRQHLVRESARRRRGADLSHRRRSGGEGGDCCRRKPTP